MTSSDLPILTLKTRAEWRKWLEKNHAKSVGIWFALHKKHTGEKSVPYEDAVRDALCFGWIDSLVKRLDDRRYLLKFTPRKPTSKWSDLNRRRWAELRDAGLLAPSGLANAPTEKRYAAKPEIPTTVPPFIAKALQADPKAWTTFEGLSPTERRRFVAWIFIAKRDDTRERRIRESIRLLAAGRKLGLK